MYFQPREEGVVFWTEISAARTGRAVEAKLARPSGVKQSLTFDPAEARKFAAQLVAAADEVDALPPVEEPPPLTPRPASAEPPVPTP